MKCWDQREFILLKNEEGGLHFQNNHWASQVPLSFHLIQSFYLPIRSTYPCQLTKKTERKKNKKFFRSIGVVLERFLCVWKICVFCGTYGCEIGLKYTKMSNRNQYRITKLHSKMGGGKLANIFYHWQRMKKPLLYTLKRKKICRGDFLKMDELQLYEIIFPVLRK